VADAVALAVVTGEAAPQGAPAMSRRVDLEVIATLAAAAAPRGCVADLERYSGLI
jgi:hypothetical protein